MNITINRAFAAAVKDRDWQRVAHMWPYSHNARDAVYATEAWHVRNEAAKDGVDIGELIKQAKAWA